MIFNLKKMSEEEFFSKREKLLRILENDIDLETSVKFHNCLLESRNFVKNLGKYKINKEIAIQVGVPINSYDSFIEQLKILSEKRDLDLLSVRLNSLNFLSADNLNNQKIRKVISEINKPVQVQLRNSTIEAKILAELSLTMGFSSIEGGAISNSISLTKSVSLEESIENWQYIDRLVEYYEKKGIKIHRETNALLTSTLVPPAISNVIQILENILAIEQGVKNISLACVQYGNLIQDIASLEALKEEMNEYVEFYKYKDINIDTVFYQWAGSFSQNAMKNYGIISYATLAAIFSNTNRIVLKNPEDYSSNYLNISLNNVIELTKSVLKLANNRQIREELRLINDEKEQIKIEMKQVLNKVKELSEGNLKKGIVKAFELGVIDIPFAPSKYNLGKMMPARDKNGMIRYLDTGNLPFDEEIKKYNMEKISERAAFEQREINFQMTVDDIFALSNGDITKDK